MLCHANISSKIKKTFFTKQVKLDNPLFLALPNPYPAPLAAHGYAYLDELLAGA